jgi:hypothetical protein
MNKQSVDLIIPIFDQIFRQSLVDENGNALSGDAAIFKLLKYCCFLEELLYEHVPDESARNILKHIVVAGTQDATDEADVHDDEDEPGSFY